MASKIRLVEYTIYLGLFAFFATKVMTSLLKYEHGLLGVSNMETHQRHRRFPSVSVCVDVDREDMSVSGFRQVRPLNETFITLRYAQHFDNGYVLCVVLGSANLTTRGCVNLDSWLPLATNIMSFPLAFHSQI